ncbi:flagellar motor switch protein FliM [Anaerobranca californiensis DSM 14826]|uniref:Flagellar motor switch protein FliM n=1 Tax=Anaerobranca californiensis DSM 14826 TaxID=1120989 RepID=A0A1M6KIG5_9FIRM|nr:flagellar motor switch protein FliM [Anaerobranca californiensis]SHJ58691.1 flagellar motor switch protein FliM [Anaerobranca californiensis DSM 14826]
MSEVLSQSEIDALLSALSSGEIDVEEVKKEEIKAKIRVYDFRRPNKFSKDQTRTLQMIHENFARLITSYLSSNLRSIVQVSVASVDQTTYEEFIRSVPNPTIINLFSINSGEGQALLEINPSIAYTIIDRLLGGPGKTIKDSRPLSEIEQRIIKLVTDKILTILNEAWLNVTNLKAKTAKIETNPQFLQIVSPNETVAVIVFKVILGESEGFMNICIPYISIETMIDKLNAHFWFSQSTNNIPENQSNVEAGLKKTYLPIAVELGKTTITIKDLLELQVGDVITLDQLTTEPLIVKVQDKVKFLATVGLLRNKLAVQITETIAEEEWDYE